ncbi:MAG: A/G-specific adenine glycosylase [Gaiellales bacterium]|nr:A/G-specific adenine glycosylase [Gaiellales bacterium]
MTGGSMAAFRREVWAFYRKGRRSFPWRDTFDPYAILVSEFMLQQTQVQRVVTAYPGFLGRFPSLEALAAGSLEEVLERWGRLGYSRRALYLHRTACHIMDRFHGVLPGTARELQALPGVGPATAAAVAAFAFGEPTVLLETNVRSAFIRHFFPGRELVADAALRPLVAEAVDRDNPRDWYYALMDLGAFLKQMDRGLTRRAAAYRTQSAFQGSRRALRAAVVREVLGGRGGREQLEELCADFGGSGQRAEAQPRGGHTPEMLAEVLGELESEGFLRAEGDGYRIA